MATPTSYQLSGHHIHVGYRTIQSGPIIAGQFPPFVTYQDPTRSLSFNGDQVETVETEAGQIVSVVIFKVGNVSGTTSTTFSFLIPTVDLADQSASSAPVHTVGITAMHRSVLNPGSGLGDGAGQVDTYTTEALMGTASQTHIHANAAA